MVMLELWIAIIVVCNIMHIANTGPAYDTPLDASGGRASIPMQLMI